MLPNATNAFTARNDGIEVVRAIVIIVVIIESASAVVESEI